MDDARLTTADGESHLLGLGEFLAVHLLAFSQELWPATLPAFGDVFWTETLAGLDTARLLAGTVAPPDVWIVHTGLGFSTRHGVAAKYGVSGEFHRRQHGAGADEAGRRQGARQGVRRAAEGGHRVPRRAARGPAGAGQRGHLHDLRRPRDHRRLEPQPAVEGQGLHLAARPHRAAQRPPRLPRVPGLGQRPGRASRPPARRPRSCSTPCRGCSPPAPAAQPPDTAAADAVDGLLGLAGSEPAVRWDYRVDGPKHRVLVLDTRTRRGYRTRVAPPTNLPTAALEQQVPAGPLPAGLELLVVVAPLPVFGLPVADELGGPLAYRVTDAVSTDEIDAMPGTDPDAAEAWVNDKASFEALLKRLAPYRKVIVLSGDVHYAHSGGASYWKGAEATPSRFAQFTSSGLKNVWPHYVLTLVPVVRSGPVARAHRRSRRAARLGRRQAGRARRPGRRRAAAARPGQAAVDAGAAAHARVAGRHDGGPPARLGVALPAGAGTSARWPSARSRPARPCSTRPTRRPTRPRRSRATGWPPGATPASWRRSASPARCCSRATSASSASTAAGGRLTAVHELHARPAGTTEAADLHHPPRRARAGRRRSARSPPDDRRTTSMSVPVARPATPIGWVGGYLAWLKDRLESDTARRAVLVDLGLDPAQVPPSPVANAPLDSIARYRQATDPDEQAFLAVWQDIMAVVEAVEAFVDVAGAGGQGHRQGGAAPVPGRSRRPSTCACATRPCTSVPGSSGSIEDVAPAGFHAPVDVVVSKDSFDNLGRRHRGAARPPRPGVQHARDGGRRPRPGRPHVDPVRHAARLLGADRRQGTAPRRRRLRAAGPPDAPGLGRGRRVDHAGGRPAGRLDGVVPDARPRPAPARARRDPVESELGATLAWVPREHGGPGLFVSVNGSADLDVGLGSRWKLNTKGIVPGFVDVLIWDSVDFGPESAAPAPSCPPRPQRGRRRRGGGRRRPSSSRFTIEPVTATPQDPNVLSVVRHPHRDRPPVDHRRRSATTGAEVGVVAHAERARRALAATVTASSARCCPTAGCGSPSTSACASGSLRNRTFALEGGSGLQATLPLDRAIGPARLQQLYLELAAGSKTTAGGIALRGVAGRRASGSARSPPASNGSASS